MDNVTFLEIESFGEIVQHAIITYPDGSYTTMLKSTYDEMIAQREASTL
jgi:hypothetical protein